MMAPCSSSSLRLARSSVSSRAGRLVNTKASSVEARKGSKAQDYLIHSIPNNGQWPTGVPPVMGGHTMPSGDVAPESTSTTVGTGGVPMVYEYASEADAVSVVTYAEGAAAAAGLADDIVTAANESIASRGCFTLAVSGGSASNALAGLVGASTDFSKWHIFFADERCVPLDSSASNYKACTASFMEPAGIPATQVYAINPTLDHAGAATDYEAKLKAAVSAGTLDKTDDGSMPSFDYVLLGLGPDGHVASLFPMRAQTAAKSGWVLSIDDSPKPPSWRITLSVPAINASKKVSIWAVGESKAEIVQRALEVQSLPGALPIQLVSPSQGTMRWFLDTASASDLSTETWGDSKLYPRSTIAK